MSKNASGYMGVQIGKLGPAVGYLWKGMQVFRAHNPFVRNPKTSKQIERRAIFTALSNLARMVSPMINRCLAQKADQERVYPRNVFFSLSYDAASFSDNVVSIDYSTLKVSDGPVTPPTFGTATFANSKLTVPFTGNNNIGCALGDDTIEVIVVNPSKDMAIHSSAAFRTDNEIEINIPASWAGNKVHVYGAARTSVDEPTFIEGYNGNVYPGMASISAYIGEVTLS